MIREEEGCSAAVLFLFAVLLPPFASNDSQAEKDRAECRFCLMPVPCILFDKSILLNIMIILGTINLIEVPV